MLENKGMRAIFQKKGKERIKYLKLWAKCIKFENILKKGSLMRANIACMKQLEHALDCFRRQGFTKILSSLTKKAPNDSHMPK